MVTRLEKQGTQQILPNKTQHRKIGNQASETNSLYLDYVSVTQDCDTPFYLNKKAKKNK